MTETIDSNRLVLRRTYGARRERVFRAWLDRDDLNRWYTPGDGWEVEVGEHTPEVGGTSTVKFGPGGGTEKYVEVATYLVIKPPSLLRFTTHLRQGERVIAETDCTVEFFDRDGSTEVVMTETGYPAEEMADRERGWTETLSHLHAVVEALA